jgi:hypothetical protein
MRVRCHAQGKFYTIECPEGTKIVRASDIDENEIAECDHLIVPLNGKAVRIPADPPELLPLLAETGNFGVSLVGEAEPVESLAGVSCLKCGEVDVAWLQLMDGTESVHCDRCGGEFEVPSRVNVPGMRFRQVDR